MAANLPPVSPIPIRGDPTQKWTGACNKAGVRYSRIPDPAHVLSAGGRAARGEEQKAGNHRMRGPVKNV